MKFQFFNRLSPTEVFYVAQYLAPSMLELDELSLLGCGFTYIPLEGSIVHLQLMRVYTFLGLLRLGRW